MNNKDKTTRKYQYLFYKRESGKCPFDKFWSTITKKMKEKVIREMELFLEYGMNFEKVHLKRFRDGIYKFRVNQGNDTARIFFIIKDEYVIILQAFIKVTQKTPEGEKIKIPRYKIDALSLIKNIEKNKDRFIWGMTHLYND